MTKALSCRNPTCNSVITLRPDGSDTSCFCGKVHAWWQDAEAGLAVVYTPDEADKPLARVIGLHNGFLNEADQLIPSTYFDPLTNTQMPYSDVEMDVHWRQIHQQGCVMPRAPEAVRIFDQSRRNCWAVIMQPGMSVDVRWATPEEARIKLGKPVLA